MKHGGAQELALKLRAEGKTYKPQKAKKNSVKVDAPSKPIRSSQPYQEEHQSSQQQQHSKLQPLVPKQEETGTRPEGDVQVCVTGC